MPNSKSTKSKQDPSTSVENDAKLAARMKIERLCRCDRILSDTESDIINFGDITKFDDNDDCDGFVFQSEECNDELEEEYLRLLKKLSLSTDTYSLTKIETNLPPCIKYGFRSGLTHLNMKKFSPLSRGYQGPACAVAAIATSYLIKSQCWNEPVIDQIVEDGDSYFINSYKFIKTDDRRTVTLLDLKRDLDIRKTHRINVTINDPIYAGTFKSESPKELHVAKALDLFFKKYDAVILTSSVLNIAIWKSSKYFNMFDAQPRLENCEVAKPNEEDGTAKLIILENLAGILFIILEKSNVQNESFLLYRITVDRLQELTSIPDEDIPCLEKPQRRPSGYRIQEIYRAIVQSSFHLHHHLFPEEFHGRGHLVLAVAALIYSKMLSSHKWTKAVLDIIFNQSNIYLTDLVRVLAKPLNETFELKINELLCDIILGVYRAKIKVRENVIPGQGKKGKVIIDSGLRDFFEHNTTGIIEIKKTFFAIWKISDKYYFFDPFGCDNEGFRIDPNEAQQYAYARACVMMNSSIDQLMKMILENTESTEKDPFIIHGLDVLYVKTGIAKDGSDEQVVFREKKTQRRPQHLPPRPVEVNECAKVIDTLPKTRVEDMLPSNEKVQYPDVMDRVEKFMEIVDEKKCPFKDTTLRDEHGRIVFGYKLKNPHRLVLESKKNCFSEEFVEASRGRQGLIIALAAITKTKLLSTTKWTNAVINKIITDANLAYEQIVFWIHDGGNKAFDSQTIADSHITTQSRDFIMIGLDFLDLEMLPETINIDNNDISVTYKKNVAEGESNPLANLGEALEQYFDQFDELIFENRKMYYGIWWEHKKYFILNPYGSDKSGWRDDIGPAVVVVVDSIIELVNFLYGVLEFNDYHFILHSIKVNLLSGEEANNEELHHSSELEPFEKYLVKFLPITDADLNDYGLKNHDLNGIKKGEESMDLDTLDSLDKKLGDTESDEGEVCIADDAFMFRLSSGMEEYEESLLSNMFNKHEEKFNALTKMFDKDGKVKEPLQPNPPARLNLSLVTGIVKIQQNDKNQSFERILKEFYERLKYRHPPPFVTPPQKNLCDLLDAKLISNSMHSLISRFSIDSKLTIKENNNLSQSVEQDATINFTDNSEKSKLITLPPKKYFFSRSLPSGLTPIRAINEKYIQDKNFGKEKEEECRKKKAEKDIVIIPGKIMDESTGMVLPTIIPLGPYIMTPKFIRKLIECPIKYKRKCPLSEKEKEDCILRKIVCSTENVLLELLLPEFGERLTESAKEKCVIADDKCKVQEVTESPQSEPEPCGFSPTDDEDIGIIRANTFLDSRETVEKSHYKSCFFAAILCILAKINIDIYNFRSTVLDRFIVTANKIDCGAGKLRIKMIRCFRNLNILDIYYNVIVKQVRYGNPEIYEPDSLNELMQSFFSHNQTGILVFGNVSYAFWLTNNIFYLFDPYACDENGRQIQDGKACLLKICNFDSFVERIIQNTGEPSHKFYRLYTISISHLEQKKKRKAKKKRKSCKEVREEAQKKIQECEQNEFEEDLAESEPSLIELLDWTKETLKAPPYDTKLPGFSPVRNYNASAIEVEVLENDITRQILAPFKVTTVEIDPPERYLPYDRKFYENSMLAEPMDLCIIAWSQIYDPPLWSVRTIQALYEANKEYTLNSVFASKDTTIPQIWDDLMTEFNIANFNFRVVFAPMHLGTLYVSEGWNLAMSLEKIFESLVYSGGIVVCGSAHVGVMKKNGKLYAWWFVLKTKNIRIIVSEDMEDYLKLIIKEINEPVETSFAIRIVTITYAKMIGPNCSDLEGLHESMMPSTSVPEIHTKENNLDLLATFRPTNKCKAPIFILGSVALNNRDFVTEPKVKKCYFAALLAVILKREIIQNPMPEMVDKILELADSLYKLFEQPKYHMEHILKDVTLNNRVFDLRDCTSELTKLQKGNESIDQVFYPVVKRELNQFFKMCTSGVIHFSNCCYGFWYSEATHCYYYLDPYPCTAKGRRVKVKGSSCLFIFASICGMAKQMCINHFEETSGFFIHRIHVEAVNPSSYDKFQEDPVWHYLDYHWSYRHLGRKKSDKSKKGKDKQNNVEGKKKPMLKNYLIEVPNMIYSLWGTIGSFDVKFAAHAGKNQTAIGIVAFALQSICHPSEWNSAVLDSAVICGDSFYKESKKVQCLYLNKFDLSECLKISPHLWNIKFMSDICGVLYGNKDQPSLAERMEVALKRSPNLLLQCEKKVLAIIQATDAFYAVDSSWTGLPLFSKNHGAIYTIRCMNTNTLIYVLTKMLNTNQKLEFVVTPVKLTYKQEPSNPMSDKTISMANKKKLLDKPVRFLPGITIKHESLIDGSHTVADEDSYLHYSRNLKLGLEHGEEYEYPMGLENLKNKKKSVSSSRKNKISKKSSNSILHKNIEYSRVVDFVKPDTECDTLSWDRMFDLNSSFVCRDTREFFDNYNIQMKKPVYKTIKHRTGNPEVVISEETLGTLSSSTHNLEGVISKNTFGTLNKPTVS